MVERFNGTLERFTEVERKRLQAFADWVGLIPLEDWPQQSRLPDGQIRPSMATNLDWKGFGEAATPVVLNILPKCGEEAQPYQFMLSVIMPGHSIEAHRDTQSPNWLFRVHIPLTTNKDAWMTLEGVDYHLEVGYAYKINTEAEHAIRNEGRTPRVHFMFDVRNP